MKFEVLHNGRMIDTREFNDGSYKIGRLKECDIYLKSAQISKQHALLVIKDGKAAVVDLGSSNGVFVNGVLVRKQRIRRTDEIAIADYRIRIAGARPTRPNAPQVGGAIQFEDPMGGMAQPFDGNLAVDPAAAQMGTQGQAEAETKSSPQEKLLLLMDEKVLGTYYSMTRSIDWRVVMGAVIGVALLLTVFASVLSLLRWGRSIATTEALRRAHTVISQTVRENYRILAQTGEYARLTVKAAEEERGILKAIIVDPNTDSIIAPVEIGRPPVNNIYEQLVINRIINGEDLVSIEKEDEVWVVGQPIYLYPKDGERKLAGIVLAHFEVPDRISSQYDQIVEAVLFAALFGLVAYFLIFKLVSHPISTMQEQLDSALKGEDASIACEAKFPELENLATVINFSVSRWKQAEAAKDSDIQVDDVEAENERLLETLRAVDDGLSDGILILDADKKVCYIGKVLEEILSMKTEYAAGQNISDCCKNTTFAGTAIDLTDNVQGAFGETQYAQLEINGVNREVTGIGYKNSKGEIIYIMIVVKVLSSE